MISGNLWKPSHLEDPQLLARSAEVVADLIERHLGRAPTSSMRGRVRTCTGPEAVTQRCSFWGTTTPCFPQVPSTSGRSTSRTAELRAWRIRYEGRNCASNSCGCLNERPLRVEILLSCDEEVGQRRRDHFSKSEPLRAERCSCWSQVAMAEH